MKSTLSPKDIFEPNVPKQETTPSALDCGMQMVYNGYLKDLPLQLVAEKITDKVFPSSTSEGFYSDCPTPKRTARWHTFNSKILAELEIAKRMGKR